MNPTPVVARIAAALLLLAAAGCTAAPPPPPPVVVAAPPPAPPPPPPAPVSDAVTIADAANGTTVHLHPGQTLTLRLSGQSGSTGYAWKIVAGPGHHLAKTGQSFESDMPPPAPGRPVMVGGGGTAIFNFAAKRPGVTFLKLALNPPGRHRHAARIFHVKVVVHA